jgi:hypothetical protein
VGIRSDTFGSVTLTGNDARQFVSQINTHTPSPAAIESARRGRELMSSTKNGEFIVPASSKNTGRQTK